MLNRLLQEVVLTEKYLILYIGDEVEALNTSFTSI
jgi:hypothetical protein